MPIGVHFFILQGKRFYFLQILKQNFDAFPVFSNDGKYLAFSSNRNNGGGRDTNLFIAEWQD